MVLSDFLKNDNFRRYEITLIARKSKSRRSKKSNLNPKIPLLTHFIKETTALKFTAPVDPG